MQAILHDTMGNRVTAVELPEDMFSHVTVIHYNGKNFVYMYVAEGNTETMFKEAAPIIVDDFGRYPDLLLMPVSREEWATLQNLREGHCTVHINKPADIVEDFNDDITADYANVDVHALTAEQEDILRQQGQVRDAEAMADALGEAGYAAEIYDPVKGAEDTAKFIAGETEVIPNSKPTRTAPEDYERGETELDKHRIPRKDGYGDPRKGEYNAFLADDGGDIPCD